MLAQLLSHASPFGPAAADEMPQGETGVMYDPQNVIDEALRKTSPSFLIGRRGSGKTAFLRSTIASDDLAIELNSPEIIDRVATTLEVLPMSNTIDPTDRIASLWDACFTAALCSAVWSESCSIDQDLSAEAFTFGYHEQSPKDGRATAVIGKYLHALRNKAKESNSFETFNSLLDETQINGVQLWQARRSLTRGAGMRNCSAVVSLDSLDRYSGMLYAGGALLTPESFALQGLFRAASATSRVATPLYRVRISFPAELWHFYSGASSNPLKDFDNSILLHWDNQELLQIAGKRFLKFLELHHPQEFRALDTKRRSSSRSRWAQEIFLRYLPRMITNGLGIAEPTIPYILRHTQLLPRHFLTIMNHIFRYRDSLSPQCITEAEIRDAVTTAERLILAGIIDSYRLPYPYLNEYCEAVIKELPFRFRSAQLHSLFNDSTKWIDNYNDFLRMMIEAGAIGRLAYSTEFYQKVDFEYLHPSRLLVTEDQDLCVHPLFAAGYDSKGIHLSGAGPEHLPILPLGSDPENPDEYKRYVHITD